MDKEKKKITLKNADGKKLLYPRTAASQVEVTSNGTMLDQYLKGMVEAVDNSKNLVIVKEAKKVSNKLKLKDASGTEKKFDGSTEVDLSGGVHYATNATNANVANAIKDTNTGANKTWSDIDSLATAAAGTQWETVGKDYVDDEIAKVKNGDITIPSASETIYGVSRLAKLEDVTSQNDSSSNDSNIAVTPNTLWRYLQSIKGENSGIASLDGTGKVPPSQLPSYVDDVLEFANKASFPKTGEDSKIYIDLATNKVYRWGGSTYVEVSSPLAIGETTGTAYDGGKGKANADAISALQTRVGTAEGGITTINGEITKLKTKDESHDASIRSLDTNKADASTVTSLQNKVSGIETTTNNNDTTLKNIIGTGNPDTDYGDSSTTQSVALAVRAIADDNGKQISTTYAKTTDIPDTSKFALKTELIDLTYDGGTEDVTY